MTSLRALLFTSHFPSSTEPTRGTYNLSAFGALARHCQLRVVGPIPWWFRTKRIGELVRVQRERVTGVDAAFPSYWSIPGATPLHAAFAYASLSRYMAEVSRTFAYDAILSTWAYPDIVTAAAFARRARRPLVATVLGSDVNELPKHTLLRPQIAWGLARAERVVAVSQALAERVAELGVARDRIVVLHNGVDGDRFALRDRAEAREAAGIAHGRPIVLYVGNVKPEKGVDVLVEAMPKLLARHEHRDVELVVVGSGSLDTELRARVNALGIGGNVTFAGRKLHDEIPTFMSACDVFCLPSRREGCPNVILEALASGKPVVASRVGGIPELLDADNGVMVPAEEPEALASGLARALDRAWDPTALRASVKNLSWEGIGLRYRDLLLEVTGN